jgi:CheY-like chemotaxis protein
VTEAVAILEHSIDPRIEIRQILTANPCTTTGDPSQIQNAALNLAINARDAMPEGGALTFETRVAELDEAYCRSVPHEIQPGRYVCLSVSDTGTGMDAQTREHIFEPFFTTKEQGEGTGMGLAAVYGTVKQHGGAVNVYSEPGHGSTFRLYFPLTGKDFREQSPSDEESRPIKPLRILLVDDEEVFRDMAGEMLAGVGHTVEAREDGQAAVEWYRAHWQEVDLVILDMIMPKMGGEAAFFEMKRINPDVKVLLASGYSINGAAQDLLAAGVRGFLHKPFTFEDITRAVAEAMDKDAG